jgi:hypothetical protein
MFIKIRKIDGKFASDMIVVSLPSMKAQRDLATWTTICQIKEQLLAVFSNNGLLIY